MIPNQAELAFLNNVGASSEALWWFKNHGIEAYTHEKVIDCLLIMTPNNKVDSTKIGRKPCHVSRAFKSGFLISGNCLINVFLNYMRNSTLPWHLGKQAIKRSSYYSSFYRTFSRYQLPKHPLNNRASIRWSRGQRSRQSRKWYS